MLNVLKRQKIELAGMDIGTSAVKQVCLEKTDSGYELLDAAVVQIEPCSGDDKQLRENTLSAVKACIQKTNWKNKNVVCGLSGPEVVVRGFNFPPLPDQAVPQAVRMEAQQVCPLDLKSSTLDYQLIDMPGAEKGSKTRPRSGVMVVGTDHIIQDHTDLLSAAGAKTIMVDVNALAVLNCLNELQMVDTNETVAVIDIGNSMSNVVIYGNDGLPFVRDLQVAGSTIAGKVAEQLDISTDQVWQNIIEQAANDQLDNKLLLAVNNAIAPLATAVNETLRFYSFQEKRSSVDRIFLCGGLALIKPFFELLTDALSVPVEALNPFSKMMCRDNTPNQKRLIENGPVFVIATGLAMRTV